MSTRFNRLVARALLLALLLVWATPTWAGPSGGPIVVNSLLDFDDKLEGDGVCETVTGNQVCTLRAAIAEANAQPGANTITFSVTGTISLTNSLPNIDESLIILGPGPDALTVQADYLPTIYSGIALRLISSQPTANFYFISGLELRGTIAQLGVNNGFLTLDNFRLAHGLNVIVFGPTARVTIRNSAFIANSSLQGTVWLEEADLFITDTLFQENQSGYGALHVDSTAVVRNSTFISNTASYSGSDWLCAGAICNQPGGRLTVLNSTLSGNSAAAPAPVALGGGGIHNSGVLTLTNVTLTGNSALPAMGGGLRLNPGSVTFILNTLIANSPQGGDCSNASGLLINGGYNLVEDNTCDFSGGSDPLLGPLADNGGPTLTHALLPGSPAIDAGIPAEHADPFFGPLFTDQRGYLREVDGNSDTIPSTDIGAFEYLSAAPNLPVRYYLPWPMPR